MRRLALSEKARQRLSNILGGVLIAVIVVCVVIVVVALLRQGASSTRPSYPATRFSTTASPSRTAVYYRNCAEAHADGRYNIPADDPAYRPGLDKDQNGVACESRKP